jgi:hypothetical protein
MGVWACQSPNEKEAYTPQQVDQEHAWLIHQLNRDLIKVVSEDLFPPPVASRIYAYSNIAAYEVLRQLRPELPTLAGTLNGLEAVPIDSSLQLYWEVAAASAYCEMAKHLVYRDQLVDSSFNRLLDTFQQIYPDKVLLDRSGEEGRKIAQHLIQWANKDGYNATRNMPRYEPLKEDFAWEATAPLYGEALEPHWFKLRPFVMDSSSQFRVDIPIPFSTEKGSDFYQAAMDVYETVNAAVQADIDKAVYWDCNPGPTMIDGHLMQVRKQNTPGGHWVGIHGTLAKSQKRSLVESSAVYAKMCVGIADAFIAAWDTKFHYHLLRPETYINRYIDKDWKPKLESPLFPEYTSAHSLVSGTAASVLAKEYGEIGFFDETNVDFGLPPKRFPNVWVAAREAANSRLLGGIHYKFGCDNGFEQGKELGSLVNQRLEFNY